MKGRSYTAKKRMNIKRNYNRAYLDDSSLVTKTAEEFLQDLVESLQVPDSRYRDAENSYNAVGNWLKRPESSLHSANPRVSAQGSFALGLVNKPVSDDENYDVDMVCEVEIDKAAITQEQLKKMFGDELAAYARKYNMDIPEPKARCWTLNYADGAQFHMDILPAVPDAAGQGLMLEMIGVEKELAKTAISITDETHPAYRVKSPHWLPSNPKGYIKWFQSRMQVVFEKRRAAIALQERASIDSIPFYRVKTPLQGAIQILKYHRDMTYDDNPDNKPISIIIATLAAQAYNQETTLTGALYGILNRMTDHIEKRLGVTWIPNPSDPRENFADRWAKHPEREQAFYDWLESARADFIAIAGLTDRRLIAESLTPALGHGLVEKALNARAPRSNISQVGKAFSLLKPAHKEAPPWQVLNQGRVHMSARFGRNGFRPQAFTSDSPALPKNCELTFMADTNIPKPYVVYWQVVNTGHEAAVAKQLRGGFDEGIVEQGRLTRVEHTRYRGSHTIECFIVKGGYCVARSGPFIVNIQ